MSSKRDWNPFALLLIDLQESFFKSGLRELFPNFPDKISGLLNLCRSEGIEIVHIRSLFNPDMSDWMVKFKLSGAIPCIQGTPGAETLPFAREQAGETIIVKHTFDGFHNPELAEYLHRRKKRFVLTAGLVTTICVSLTTASAAQNGFLASLVADCCAAVNRHDEMLDWLEGFTLGRTSSEEIPEKYDQWQQALTKLAELEA